MRTEYEAKFLDIDPAVVRARLAELGATLRMPERLMRRTVFHPPVAMDRAWLRVRDEGDRITMSFKQVTGTGIEDQREAELVIHDFEAGRRFLHSIGAVEKAYQETLRESYSLDGADVEIDTWPGLPTFVEIEAGDEATVRAVAEKLGFDWSEAVFGAVAQVYERTLGIPRHIINDHTPEITFERPPARVEATATATTSPVRMPRTSPFAALVAAYFGLSAFVMVFARPDFFSGGRGVFAALLGPTIALVGEMTPLGREVSFLGLLAYAVFTVVFLSFLLIPFELRSRTGRIIAFVCIGVAWLLFGLFTDGVASYR